MTAVCFFICVFLLLVSCFLQWKAYLGISEILGYLVMKQYEKFVRDGLTHEEEIRYRAMERLYKSMGGNNEILRR